MGYDQRMWSTREEQRTRGGEARCVAPPRGQIQRPWLTGLLSQTVNAIAAILSGSVHWLHMQQMNPQEGAHEDQNRDRQYL
jgi:hypothetical protein